MKVSDTKFQENPSSGSQVDTCAQTDEWTDMKLLGAFSDNLKAPEKKFIFNWNESPRFPWSRKWTAPRKYVIAYGVVCLLP